MTVQTLAQRTQSLQSRYDRESGVRAAIVERIDDVETKLADVGRQIEIGDQVQLLFTKTSEFARARVKSHVEATVTAALQSVFGQELRFQVVLREVGNQTAADWRVIDAMGDAEVAGDPEDARGGGVSDVVSLALRLAMLELVRPRLEGPLLLDEPCKHLSAQYHDALGAFLKAYAARTGRQIIVVTHIEQLAAIADVSYRVERRDGISEAVRL